ncbi:MAG: DUF5979 domain-containing protein, partial [Eubacterium sp.]|nr:DUF5979 domain-containing protein [Eubacterium sp.]
KGGEAKTAEGLPTTVGYTVTEAEVTGFELSSKTGDTGTITETASQASFTNTRKTGDLKVSKILVSDLAADADQEFEFTVTLDDTSITGTYGDMTFASGVATFNLKGGEDKTAEGLPTTVGFTVTEAANDNFVTDKTNDTGTITETASQASFTNTRKTSGLKLSKTVVSTDNADKTKEFEFKVSLSDKSISGTYGHMTFANGETTLKLKDGDVKVASGLPIGITYKVEETANPDFKTTSTGDEGTISETLSEAAFINTAIGDLKVGKIVVSTESTDKTRKFEFKVNILDDNDKTDTSFTGTYGDMTFTSGVASFKLSDGDSKTASGIPLGTKYKVEEPLDPEFQTTSTGDSGTISHTVAEAEFVNAAIGGLVVRKKLDSTYQADSDREFEFKVELSDKTINATYGDMEFINGVASFKLKGGQEKTASGLALGLTYKVTETVDSDFITSKTGDSGSIGKNVAVAEFTNTSVGGLEVRKTVNSPYAADKDIEFTFQVKLSDDTINGTYGDMTFVNGIADFTLKDGASQTASGIPSGITYEVTESANAGFDTSSVNTNGTIERQIPKAEFINTAIGDLRVSKTLESSFDGDKNLLFNFEVELSDKTINGDYGDMTFTDGKASFTLKDGDSKIANGIPCGIDYRVTEVNDSGFVTSRTGHEGTIAKEESKAEFINKETIIKISKVDITNDIELPGATIQILDENGNIVVDKNGNAIEWVSGDQPKEITGLKTGVTYTLRETVAPSGYQLTTDTTFTLNEDGSLDGDKTTTSTNSAGVLLVEDWPQGTVVVNKRGLVYEECGDKAGDTEILEGVEFTLTKKGNASFGPISKKTNENGIVAFENLDAGIYIIKESDTLDGFLLDEKTYLAEVDYKGQYLGLKDEDGQLVDGNLLINDSERTDIEFTKVNLSDPDQPLEGSTYGLFKNENGELKKIAENITDKDGKIRFEGVKIDVEYTIKELVAPDGFYVSSNPISLSFTKNSNGKITVKFTDDGNGTIKYDENGNFTWLEPMVEASFLKVDETGKGLAGAKLEVRDEAGNVIEAWTSTDEAHVIKGILISGKNYKLVETEAPSGYEKAEAISFTVESTAGAEGADIISVTMTDKKIKEVTPEKEETKEETSKETSKETPKETPKETQKQESNQESTPKSTTPSAEVSKNTTTTNPTPATSVSTGDSAPIALIVILCIIALLAVISIIIIKKRNSR